MSLIILDSEQNAMSGSLITTHNGFTGGQFESLIYIKNNNVGYFYENIQVSVVMDGLDEGDIFSTSGWSIKLKATSEQPTEKEWGDILVNSTVSVADIGTAASADTTTMRPVWVRIFCPGHTDPQIKTDMKLNLKYYKKVVGS
mgnify:FL=1